LFFLRQKEPKTAKDGFAAFLCTPSAKVLRSVQVTDNFIFSPTALTVASDQFCQKPKEI